MNPETISVANIRNNFESDELYDLKVVKLIEIEPCDQNQY
jgi:hypothetical protein